jgi:CspA family cold shock protein
MIKGTIKFFNKAKGFGFITPDDGARDVFLPPTTVTTAGAARLKTGQRVAFEFEPDVKGPKAVKLELLDEAPKEMPAPAAKAGLTLYYDSEDDFEEVLEALKAAGHQPRLVDYATTPLAHDQLKRLGLMLREVDQSLVRRYDHLFLELQLDDRFISENDFWTAIVEHPTLINGPVVVSGNKARICKTAGEVRAFLGMDGDAAGRKPKAISPRMMAMLTGRPVPSLPPVEEEEELEEEVEEAVAAEPGRRATIKLEAKPKAKKAAAKKAPARAEAPAKLKKKAAPAKPPQKAKAPAKKSKR